MTRLLVATTNPGKLAEFAAALAKEGIEVVGLATLATLAEVQAVEETGATFEANARLKAEAYSHRTDLLVVADDSGLEVDALDGAPGVHSARYAGPTLTDAARTRALLDALASIPDAKRTARFRCVLAAARAGKTLALFEGVVEGRILREPRGTHGFGYDPIFLPHAASKSFAELTREEKTHLSHRGQALQKLAAALRGQTLNC
jgi:XTP/dITP diphosphohydrolase